MPPASGLEEAAGEDVLIEASKRRAKGRSQARLALKRKKPAELGVKVARRVVRLLLARLSESLAPGLAV